MKMGAEDSVIMAGLAGAGSLMAKFVKYSI